MTFSYNFSPFSTTYNFSRQIFSQNDVEITKYWNERRKTKEVTKGVYQKIREATDWVYVVKAEIEPGTVVYGSGLTLQDALQNWDDNNAHHHYSVSRDESEKEPESSEPFFMEFD